MVAVRSSAEMPVVRAVLCSRSRRFEGGLLQRIVHLHHRRQMEARRFFPRQRRAEDAAGVADHEGDLLRLRFSAAMMRSPSFSRILVVRRRRSDRGGEAAMASSMRSRDTNLAR